LEGKYGTTVAVRDNKITYNKLSDIAGKTKFISNNHQMVNIARAMGISLGDGQKYKLEEI
jgi:6-phosphofructokinase 1